MEQSWPVTMHSASGRSALKGLTGLMLDAQHMVISEIQTIRVSSSHVYIYGKCLGFARTRNDDRRRIIIIRIKPLLLKIFNECRSLTGVGELNPYQRSSMNVEV